MTLKAGQHLRHLRWDSHIAKVIGRQDRLDHVGVTGVSVEPSEAKKFAPFGNESVLKCIQMNCNCSRRQES